MDRLLMQWSQSMLHQSITPAVAVAASPVETHDVPGEQLAEPLGVAVMAQQPMPLITLLAVGCTWLMPQ